MNNNVLPSSPSSSSTLPTSLRLPELTTEKKLQKLVQKENIGGKAIPMNLLTNCVFGSDTQGASFKRLRAKESDLLAPKRSKMEMPEQPGLSQSDLYSDETPKPACLSTVPFGLEPIFGMEKMEGQSSNEFPMIYSQSDEDQGSQLKKEEKSNKEGAERATNPTQFALPEPSTPPGQMTQPKNMCPKKKTAAKENRMPSEPITMGREYSFPLFLDPPFAACKSGEERRGQLKEEEGAERATTPTQFALPEPSTPPDQMTQPKNMCPKKKAAAKENRMPSGPMTMGTEYRFPLFLDPPFAACKSGEEQGGQLKEEEDAEQATTPTQLPLSEPSTPPDQMTQPKNMLLPKPKMKLPSEEEYRASEASIKVENPFLSGFDLPLQPENMLPFRPLESLNERLMKGESAHCRDFGPSFDERRPLKAESDCSDDESVIDYFEE